MASTRLRNTAAALVTLAAFLGLRAQTKPDYAHEIRPILEASCYSCHGEKVQSGGFRLDQKQSALPKLSRIPARISGDDNQPRMPLGAAPLTAAQITLVKAWIDSGAD